jgi:hypothetical protein
MKDQTRNLNPIAPAIVAMTIWGHKYAAQRGGSMDFWDSLSDEDRRLCREVAERVKETPLDETSPS